MRGAVRVRPATAADVPAVVAVVHAAFAARPVLDPPSTQLLETEEPVGAVVAGPGGLVAEVGGQVVGAVLLGDQGERLGLHRVSVHPDHQRKGVAGLLTRTAEEIARDRGCTGLEAGARVELPETVEIWRRYGYALVDRAGPHLTMAKELPFTLAVPEADDARALGHRLAPLLRAGDLLILTGDLGAGKTTFTQGLGQGLGVRGQVTSPTFILARAHRPLGEGPGLVHVDAYRLGGVEELDDLDLDSALATSVAVVEWGEGLAESLAEDRLEITLRRQRGDERADDASAIDDTGIDDTDPREVEVRPVGARWVGAGLWEALRG